MGITIAMKITSMEEEEPFLPLQGAVITLQIQSLFQKSLTTLIAHRTYALQLQAKISTLKRKLTPLRNGRREWRSGKPDKRREVLLPKPMMEEEMIKTTMIISGIHFQINILEFFQF